MSERPEIVACMQTHHEDHANTKNDGREELEAQRDQPRRVRLTFARAADVIGAVIDPESNHDTSGNSHLLHADHGASNFRRRTLCIVHRYDH